MSDASALKAPGGRLEERVRRLGRDLSERLGAVLAALPEGPHGTQKLATLLGVDKVLTSRLLKALRQRDPVAVLHHLPGPHPLRRALAGARARGVPAAVVAGASESVRAFEELIKDEAGGRSSLGAILAAWLPEARAEFELRRKQAAFKAISELKGYSCETDFSAVTVLPSASDPERLDVVWLIGKLGLRRLRPGVRVKFATRRLAPAGGPRRPTNLDGEEIEGLDRARLDVLGGSARAPIQAQRAGETVHYLLGDTGFGPRSAADVVFCEVNRAELSRRVPAGSGRRAFFFADVDTPARRMQFDAFIHRDAYPGADAELFLYDTAGSGSADPNDPARDLDRLETADTVERLGPLAATLSSGPVPRYAELVEQVLEGVGARPEDLRGYRCRIDYPIHSSQVCLAFRAPELEK